MSTNTTDPAQLGGTPDMLPTLPPITPHLRVPVRLIGQAPTWTAEVVAALAQDVCHVAQHTTNGAVCTPQYLEVER